MDGPSCAIRVVARLRLAVYPLPLRVNVVRPVRLLASVLAETEGSLWT